MPAFGSISRFPISAALSGSNSYSETGTGGVLCAGSATPTVVYSLTVSDGALAAGDGNYSAVFDLSVSGGSLAAGDASISTENPTDIPPCSCGYGLYEETVSGGATGGGSATLAVSREQASGGAVCGGSASVSTNQVWDGYALVFHLEESGDGTTGEYVESARGLDGTGGNGVASAVPSRINSIHSYGQRFDGTDFISVPSDGAAPPFTLSCWAKRDGRFINRYFVSRGQTNGSLAEGWQVALGYDNAGFPLGRAQFQGEDNWVKYSVSGPDEITIGCWYHLALICGDNDLTIFVNGQVVATTAIAETDLAPSSAGSYLGRIDNSGYHSGDLDEVRVYAGVLSDDRIETDFLNLCDSEFITYGTEQQFGIS